MYYYINKHYANYLLEVGMILYCSANSSTANEEILLWMLSSFELLWSFLFTLRWDANFSVYLVKTLFVMRIKCRNTKTAPVDTQRLQREKKYCITWCIILINWPSKQRRRILCSYATAYILNGISICLVFLYNIMGEP